jgi:hypothetical protein
MDLRDVGYDLTHWEWTWGHAGQTALDAIGLIPVIGVVKYGDEIGAALKHSDELAPILRRLDEVGAGLGNLWQGVRRQWDEFVSFVKGSDDAGDAAGGARRGGQEAGAGADSPGSGRAPGQEPPGNQGSNGRNIPPDLDERAAREGLTPQEYLLGLDENGVFRRWEVDNARRTEELLGIDLHRTDGVDWVGSDGRYYDGLGPLPPGGLARPEPQLVSQFNSAIDNHFLKIGEFGQPVYLTVDLTGVPPTARESILAYIDSLPVSRQELIILLPTD